MLLGVANGCLLAFVTSVWAIPSFLGKSAGAASTGLINCIALTGRFTGPYLTGHLTARTHSFHAAFVWLMLAAFMAVVAVLLVRVSSSRSHALNAVLVGASEPNRWLRSQRLLY